MSWSDRNKQVATLTIAGGVDKPLVIQGSGLGRVIQYMPPPAAAKTSSTTLTADELLSGFITGDISGGGTLTLPSAPDIAAFLNPADPAQTGTNLQVGSSFEFSVFNDDAIDDLNVAAGVGISWATDDTELRVLSNAATGMFRLRFTDVTVGSETADLFRVGSPTP